MNRQNDVPLIIARGISKQPTKDGAKTITKLFFDVETIQQIVAQIAAAIDGAEDGVSISLLEGEGKKGPYGMISVTALQANPNRAQGGQKRAYNPPAQQAQGVGAPFTPPTGGYKPKTPGYSKPFGNK